MARKRRRAMTPHEREMARRKRAMRTPEYVVWEYKPPRMHVSVERIKSFRRARDEVYVRAGGLLRLARPVPHGYFQDGDRRLLMRCWSGSRYTKSSFSASFEIKGLTAAMLSKTDEYGLLLQSYIPVEVRRSVRRANL